MRLHQLLCILALGVSVVACQDGRPHNSARSIATQHLKPATIASTTTSVTYRGAGFALELPAGSRVGHGSEVDTLVGPLIREPGRSPDLGGPGPHPTFELEVSVAPNPRRVPLAVWADSVYRADTASAEDFAKPGPVERDTLGGEAALRLERFCGDCEAQRIYVARGNQVVSFTYEKGIHLAGTREQQETAYRRVLRTFR